MSGNDHRIGPGPERCGEPAVSKVYSKTYNPGLLTEHPGTMRTESETGRPWPAPLGSRLPQDADSQGLADCVLEVWTEVEDALHPIIGRRGVGALYNRSLKVTTASYPWLGGADQNLLTDRDPARLRTALAAQTAPEAAAGALALFRAFRELLASLVGASLTDSLLQPVWAPSSGAPPVQDTLS
jgi:hypothetical protein